MTCFNLATGCGYSLIIFLIAAPTVLYNPFLCLGYYAMEVATEWGLTLRTQSKSSDHTVFTQVQVGGIIPTAAASLTR